MGQMLCNGGCEIYATGVAAQLLAATQPTFLVGRNLMRLWPYNLILAVANWNSLYVDSVTDGVCVSISRLCSVIIVYQRTHTIRTLTTIGPWLTFIVNYLGVKQTFTFTFGKSFSPRLGLANWLALWVRQLPTGSTVRLPNFD